MPQPAIDGEDHVAAPDSLPVVIDGGAESVLRSLQSAYRSRRVVERISVSVESGGIERTDELVFASDPGVGFSIDLGLITVFASRERLVAIHDLNSDQFWSAEVSGGNVRAALERELPPLPLPQIALAWDAPAPPGGDTLSALAMPLTPYETGAAWSIEQATDESGEVTARLKCEGPSGTSTLLAVITADNARLAATRVEDRASGTIISTAIVREIAEPVDIEADTPVVSMPDVSAREPVESIGLLRPRPGDIAPGERLPDMLLSRDPATNRGPESSTRVQGPAAIVLSLLWTDTLDHPRDAMALLQAETPELNLYRVAVVDPALGELKDTLSAARARTADAPLWFSMSPAHTLRRFSARVPAVIVVIDEAGIVKQVIEIRPIRGGTEFDEEIPVYQPRNITAMVRQALGVPLRAEDQLSAEFVGPAQP